MIAITTSGFFTMRSREADELPAGERSAAYADLERIGRDVLVAEPWNWDLLVRVLIRRASCDDACLTEPERAAKLGEAMALLDERFAAGDPLACQMSTLAGPVLTKARAETLGGMH